MTPLAIAGAVMVLAFVAFTFWVIEDIDAWCDDLPDWSADDGDDPVSLAYHEERNNHA
jgi:hypothetical protein